ncbi:MAG: DegT/DnrJ/EryC1/StrS family aminotransferase, partial [Thermodesulfobacteriota bacterium]
MCEPSIGAAERAAVLDVLSTPVLALGPRLDEFERALATRVEAAHGVGVSSGTSGLHLCMIAAGVAEGDVVLTTPFSFVASANCVLYERATPWFVDVERDTLTIDPARLELELAKLLRRGERVKAILPVHVFGQPCDMDAILDLAERHGIAVIEDACEAIGAEYNGRAVGALGDAGVFAFYPNKQMTTGEGGMVVTNRADWDVLFRSLRNQGRDVFDGWLEHSRLGYNYRLDELAAALGIVQLARLDELLAGRERVAAWYDARLAGHDCITLPQVAPWTTRTSWFVYVIRLATRALRDLAMNELAVRGIPARQYFPPIHLQRFYRERFGFRPGDFPVAEAAGDTCLALPFFPAMREEQVDE